MYVKRRYNAGFLVPISLSTWPVSLPTIPFGNRVLTMISVWLGLKDARRALVLTCWQGMQASALDGPPMRHIKAPALALTAAACARLWNRQPFAPEDLGRLR